MRSQSQLNYKRCSKWWLSKCSHNENKCDINVYCPLRIWSSNLSNLVNISIDTFWCLYNNLIFPNIIIPSTMLIHEAGSCQCHVLVDRSCKSFFLKNTKKVLQKWWSVTCHIPNRPNQTLSWHCRLRSFICFI